MPYMALEGVRVVDMACGIAGSFCSKLLGQYGAEVFKIESAGTQFASSTPLSLYLDAGKKSISINIHRGNGIDVLRQLIAHCNVVIEDSPPGTMQTLGLGYENLRSLRSDLILTSVTPFGQAGPHKNYTYTELTMFAMSGAMYREGIPGREPLKYGGELSQYFAGNAAAAVTAAAIFRVAMQGKGDWIDISIQECMAGHPHQIGRRAPYAYASQIEQRSHPRVSASRAREPYAVGTFRCADGYMSFLPLGPHMWPKIATMIGRSDLIEDPRFQTSAERVANWRELEIIFQKWLDRRNRSAVFKAIQEAGIPGAPVLTIDEVLKNEQYASRKYFVAVEHKNGLRFLHPGDPFKLSESRHVPLAGKPRPGINTRELLSQILNMNDEELADLENTGII